MLTDPMMVMMGKEAMLAVKEARVCRMLFLWNDLYPERL